MNYDKTVFYWLSPKVNTEEKFVKLREFLIKKNDDGSEEFKKRREDAIHHLSGYFSAVRKKRNIRKKLNEAGNCTDDDLVIISTKSASADVHKALSNCTKDTRLYIFGHGSQDKIEDLDAFELVRHLRENGLKAAKRIIIYACGYDGTHVSLASQTCRLLGLGPELGSKTFKIPIDEYNWPPIKCEVAGFDSSVGVNPEGQTIIKKGDKEVTLREDVESKKRSAEGRVRRQYHTRSDEHAMLAKTIYKWDGETVVAGEQMFV